MNMAEWLRARTSNCRLAYKRFYARKAIRSAFWARGKLDYFEPRILLTGIVANPSFETDALSHTGAPTGWTLNSGVSSIVVGTDVTDGAQAVQISETLANGTTEYSALSQWIGSPSMTLGDTYTVTGSLTINSTSTAGAVYLA